MCAEPAACLTFGEQHSTYSDLDTERERERERERGIDRAENVHVNVKTLSPLLLCVTPTPPHTHTPSSTTLSSTTLHGSTSYHFAEPLQSSRRPTGEAEPRREREPRQHVRVCSALRMLSNRSVSSVSNLDTENLCRLIYSHAHSQVCGVPTCDTGETPNDSVIGSHDHPKQQQSCDHPRSAEATCRENMHGSHVYTSFLVSGRIRNRFSFASHQQPTINTRSPESISFAKVLIARNPLYARRSTSGSFIRRRIMPDGNHGDVAVLLM